jgi:hypothetical protein
LAAIAGYPGFVKQGFAKGHTLWVRAVFSSAALSGKGLNKALARSNKAWSSLAAPADVPASSAVLHTAATAIEENTHVNLCIKSLQ